MNENEICLIPNCGKRAKTRGLCMTCYGSVHRLIKRNITTFQEMVEVNLLLPRQETRISKLYQSLLAARVKRDAEKK